MRHFLKKTGRLGPISEGEHEIATDDTPVGWAVIEEYKHVTSLIRMYRGFQMQALNFTIILYTAILALIGGSLENGGRLAEVASYSTALVSYPIALFVFAFAVMEIRVMRVGTYIKHDICEQIQATAAFPNNIKVKVMQWESAQDRYLPALPRVLAKAGGTIVFLFIIGGPALVMSTLHLLGLFEPRLPFLASTGVGLLGVSLLLSFIAEHQVRRSQQEAHKTSLTDRAVHVSVLVLFLSVGLFVVYKSLIVHAPGGLAWLAPTLMGGEVLSALIGALIGAGLTAATRLWLLPLANQETHEHGDREGRHRQ